eukprot:164503-Pyramimonas_sp.AAC.1
MKRRSPLLRSLTANKKGWSTCAAKGGNQSQPMRPSQSNLEGDLPGCDIFSRKRAGWRCQGRSQRRVNLC